MKRLQKCAYIVLVSVMLLSAAFSVGCKKEDDAPVYRTAQKSTPWSVQFDTPSFALYDSKNALITAISTDRNDVPKWLNYIDEGAKYDEYLALPENSGAVNPDYSDYVAWLYMEYLQDILPDYSIMSDDTAFWTDNALLLIRLTSDKTDRFAVGSVVVESAEVNVSLTKTAGAETDEKSGFLIALYVPRADAQKTFSVETI